MTNTAVTLAGASTTEGTSGGDPFYLSFAVMLSAPASNDVTVQYRLLSGTARAGDDAYYPTPLRSVTFAAGETSKTIDIRVNADSLDEPDEAVVLEVYSASDGAVLAGGATTLRATGWILDDDGNGNKLAMFASRPVVVEGDSGTTQAHFELWLSRPAPQAFTVDYSTVDGSAIAGEDYVASSGTISFVQGQTSASVSVPVLGDTAVEPSDLFTLAFTAPSIVAQASQGEATILDDDAGTPTVSVAGASTTEGTSGSDPFYLSFAVMLSAPASNDVTVQYRLLSGTARAGDDAYYPTPLRSVTFAAGETSKTIDIRVNADSLDEPDEAVVLEVYSASDGAVLAGGATTLRATGWILDDDGNGNKLAMFASRPVVVEGDSGTTQAHFELSLSRPAPQAFTVDYSTVDGSAIAGEDYVASSGTISFVQGQTSASVSVPVLGDTAVEPSDLFTLAFTAPSIVAQASQGEATILDDDAGTPTVSVAGASTTEGTSGSDPFYLSFAVMLSAPASNDVTVQYRLLSGTAQAGDDAYYPTPLRSVTFAAGETSKTIDIRVNADSLDEPDEAVVLEVYSASDGAVLAGGATTLRATGWILDDDGNGNKLAMFASRPVVVEGDSGTTQAHFELWLSRPAPQAFTVDYSTVDGSAIAGEDYVASSGTISFVQGQTSASVSVPVLGDTAVEPSDLFTLAFTAPSIVAQASQGEATILDDDAGTPTVSVAGASTTEGTSGSDPFYLSFAVMLSAPASNDVTVQYRLLSGTAQAGDDAYYPTPLRSVTFAAGETSKTIDIRVDADRLDEPDEAVVLEVYSASGGAVLAGGATTLRATGWILDDDDGSGTKLAMFTSRPVVVEGDSGTRQAHFELLLSRPAPQTFTVDYTTADGSAIADQDYIASSGTITFVQGQSSASVAVQVLGDTEIETDELFSLAVTFGGATSRADATIENDDYFDVTVPATLAPGAAGQARITYEHHTLNGAPLDINAALFFVTGERALVQDPFTGRFDDQVFLLSYGDGSGDIAAGETGTSDFEVNGTGGPRAGYTVSASIIDFDAIIDWEASIGLIRPAGIEDAAWTDLSERLIERFGTTGADFVNALAAHGLKLQTFGLNGESASAALAFLTDVVGDFGSIAGRAASGAMGAGWATLADIGLSFEGDTVILEGLPDLSLLRSLNPSGAAFYTISESASRASNLTGSIISDAPISGVRFVETEVGTYASTALTDVTLVDTSDGFAVEYSGGARLLFDASGAFLKLVEADGREITASRDANGAIAGFTGPQGAELSFTRDADGSIQAIADADGSRVGLLYNGAGQLVSATSDTGTALFGYDAAGNLASAKVPGIGAAQITYDSELRLSAIDYGGSLQTETFTYDGVGGVTLTDGESRTTTVDYLPGGAVGRVADGEGNVSSLIFNEGGDLIGIRAPDGTETTFTFDDSGRLTSLTDANAASVHFGYVGDSEAPASFTDASGSTRSFTYDDGGRITEAQWADGTSLAFSYDANGNLSMSESRRGESIDYTYDSNGRLIAQSDGSTGAVSYSYDARGRLTSAVDERGTTGFEYDSAGRITKITYPEGRSLAYAYNDAGLRTSMTDHSGDALLYEYDDLGRLIGLDGANGAIVDYTFDTAGNLIREENGNGTVSTFTYDGANRLTEIVNAKADGAVNSFYRYTYDAAGQRVEMESHDGTWTYGYDAIGQLTSADFASTNPLIADKNLVYEYDQTGNRIRVVEDGVETLYTANALNQYTAAGDATFTYDDDGNMVSKTDASGTTTYEYDLNNRLARVVAADGTGQAYEYDVFGNRVATTTDGERTEFLVDPTGLGNVIADFGPTGDLKAKYVYGAGLVSATVFGDIYFFDADAMGSVANTTGNLGTNINSYAYLPFGRIVFEIEVVDNRFQFNGEAGVEESLSGLYMRLREYDPSSGRFFSEEPDQLLGDQQNLYRFGHNNPITYFDPLGADAKKWFDRANTGKKIGEAVDNAKEANDAQKERQKKIDDSYVNDDGAADPEKLRNAKNDTVDNGKQYIEELIKGIIEPWIPDFIEHNFPLLDMRPQGEEGMDSVSGGLLDKRPDEGEGKGAPRDEPPADDNGQNDYADSSVGRGDPWVSSFDGNGTPFHAYGEFVYARSDDGEFEVQARQLPFNDRSPLITSIYAAATRIGDNKVEIQWVGAGQSLVLVNGTSIAVEVGESIAIDDGSIYRSSLFGYVVNNGLGDGMSVRIGSSYMEVYPFIDPSRAGVVQGVHGNYDGDRSNDFALPDGTVLGPRISFQELYTTFADAWRVTDETSLFTYLTGQGTADFTNLDFPRGLVRLEDLDPAAVAAAEAIAIAAGLEPGTWLFETTVFDIAFTGDASYAQTSADAPDFAFVSADGTPDEIVTAEIDAPPILGEFAATADEDGTVTIDVLAEASDPEGNPLILVSGSDPNGGTVTVEDGKLVFVPAPDFEGGTVLTYVVRDAAGNQVEGQVPVTVAGVPDAPVAADDSFVTPAGATLLVAADAGLLINDSDADGDLLQVVDYEQAANGALSIAVDGSFAYAPNAGFDGEEVIEYTVSDGIATSMAFLTIGVEAALGTVSVDAGLDTAIAEGQAFNRTISFNDGEDSGNDGWIYEVDWDGDGVADESGSVAAGEASFDITHVFADGPATQAVSVAVTDDVGESDSATFDVTVNNVAPTIALEGAASLVLGSNYILTLGGIDDAGSDTVTSYTIDWGDGNSETVATSGDFTYAYVGTGTYSISVSLTDEDGIHADAGNTTVEVTAPIARLAIAAGADASIEEGGTFTRTIAFSDGEDNGGAGWGYTIDYGDGRATEIGTTLAKSLDLSHEYTDGDAVSTVTVTLTDEAGESATDSFRVNVVNVAPIAVLSGANSVDEGASYTLNLGAITDPGDDTVNNYVVDWGDGSSDTYASTGDVTHVYADGDASPTIRVDLVDEDGTHTAAGSKSITVDNVAPRIALGGADNADEGAIYTLNLGAITDPGTDTVSSLVVDWGDGNSSDTYAAGGDVTHVYADGDASHTISVELVDEDGTHTNAGSKTITVANISPLVALAGADNVDEGATYTLNLGAITDPGDDTVSSFVVDWGDGSSDTYASAGDVTHVYADGDASHMISVDLVDEDGTHSAAGSKSITVDNVAPGIALGGAGSVNEGTTYTLSLGAITDLGTDTVSSFVVDWGDGSSDTYTRAGDVTHVYADGAASHTISVDLVDEDGTHSVAGSKTISVANIAPQLALAGADNVDEGATYTLNLGAITDPGDDSVSSYVVHWGDGTASTHAAGGDVTHAYADGAGDIGRTITIDLVDEDGSYNAVASKPITVLDVTTPTRTVTLGNATGQVSFMNLNAWAPFWTELSVAITHKADYQNAGEAWTPGRFNALSPATLAGGDLYAGDLGVSGQNLATSSIRQEIQGTEALRFDLTDTATRVTVGLSKLFQDDDGNLLNHNEAGRVQAFDAAGNVVAELTFTPDSSDGQQSATLEHGAGFNAVVITAGAYDPLDEFIFGAYVDDSGTAVDPYTAAGSLHGSDFLINDISFEMPILGLPLDTGS